MLFLVVAYTLETLWSIWNEIIAYEDHESRGAVIYDSVLSCAMVAAVAVFFTYATRTVDVSLFETQ